MILDHVIILQRGLAPIKKKLPEMACQQKAMLQELIATYPDALMVILDFCDTELFLWAPKQYLDMIEMADPPKEILGGG